MAWLFESGNSGGGRSTAKLKCKLCANLVWSYGMCCSIVPKGPLAKVSLFSNLKLRVVFARSGLNVRDLWGGGCALFLPSTVKSLRFRYLFWSVSHVRSVHMQCCSYHSCAHAMVQDILGSSELGSHLNDHGWETLIGLRLFGPRLMYMLQNWLSVRAQICLLHKISNH